MKRRGFSLLELLVALGIVALLAAIALPGYGAIMRRAQRNDARLALLAIQHAEELHYLGFNAYSDALTQSVAQGGLGLATHSTSGNYQLSIQLRGGGQGFLASARPAPQGRQSADHDCALLTIDETGRSGASDANAVDASALCWR